MSSPRTKIVSARKAAAAAIDEIVDGTWFAVVVGRQRPGDVVYPRRAAAWCTPRRSPAAERQDGGAAPRPVGWHRDRQLAASRDRAVRDGARRAQCHAILLTDGRTRPKTPAELQAGIDGATAQVFQCDCRGVGADWEVNELRGDRVARCSAASTSSPSPRRWPTTSADDAGRDGPRRRRREAARLDAARLGAAVRAAGRADDRGPHRPRRRRCRRSSASSRPDRGATSRATTTSP